ncbi:hypothetical protein ACIBCN_14670 [Nocardia sp. NPDC051052]|uniref:hypothetical protein n=1 Tax=Nocardia sp. NPDC051052 TaxID=3364322 RepID=UPI0037AD384B
MELAVPGCGPWGPLLFSVVSLLALGVSGYLVGMLAYCFCVRVADEKTRAAGYRNSA